MRVLNSPMNHPLHDAMKPRSFRSGVNYDIWYNYCLAWYDANVSYVTKDGSDNVSAWANRALYDGTSKDLAQATAAKQPVWVDAVINGLPVIRFDGAAVNGDTLTTANPTLGWPLSYYVVGQKKSTQTGRHALVNLGSYYSEFGTADPYWDFRGTTTNLGIPGIDVPAIIVAHFYPGATWVLCSGIGKSNTVNYGASLISGSTGITIGSILDGSEAANWDIAEVLIVVGVLPDAIDSSLLSYLSNKYGITI